MARTRTYLSYSQEYRAIVQEVIRRGFAGEPIRVELDTPVAAVSLRGKLYAFLSAVQKEPDAAAADGIESEKARAVRMSVEGNVLVIGLQASDKASKALRAALEAAGVKPEAVAEKKAADLMRRMGLGEMIVHSVGATAAPPTNADAVARFLGEG